MKNLSALFAFAFLFMFSHIGLANSPETKEKLKGVPENVKSIIENSCYGCHNSESKNEDAREELNFDNLDELSKIKKIGSYKHIGETVEKNEMPPKRFLERYPDKSLTDDQKKVLIEWAKKEAEALVKNN